MTPTKEELDEAIAFLTDGFRQDASVIKTALTILTKYRDGQLVEKCSPDVEKGLWNQVLDYCANHHLDDIRVLEYLNRHYSIQPLPTPPTNQTER